MKTDQTHIENRIYRNKLKLKKRRSWEGLHFYVSYSLLVSQAIETVSIPWSGNMQQE